MHHATMSSIIEAAEKVGVCLEGLNVSSLSTPGTRTISAPMLYVDALLACLLLYVCMHARRRWGMCQMASGQLADVLRRNG